LTEVGGEYVVDVDVDSIDDGTRVRCGDDLGLKQHGRGHAFTL
jgi:hypothetical protein